VSDTIDDFRALKQWRQMKRDKFGVACPVCIERLPRAHPKILLPQQTCRAHRPHYRDPRPELTTEDYDTLCEDSPNA